MNTTIKLVVTGLAALAVGVGIGAAGTGATATPEPAPTVTVSAPPKVETKTVEKAPAACMQALDDAEIVIGLSQQAILAMAEGADAGSRLDVAGIEAATEKVQALTPKMGDARQAYDAAAGQCRGAA